MCVLSVVCWQVEVSATDLQVSLVQRGPTDCGASLCVIKKPRTRGRYSPTRGLEDTNPQWVAVPVEKKDILLEWKRKKLNIIVDAIANCDERLLASS